MNKKLLAGAVAAIAAAFAASLYFSSESSKPLEKAHGIVDIRESSLSFERSGRIVSFEADSGDLVKKGQVLARLDTQDLEHQERIKSSQCQALKAQYDLYSSGYRKEEIAGARGNVRSLESALQLARSTSERYTSLYSTRSVSAQERDKAFYEMGQTEGELEKARADLALKESGYRKEEIAQAQGNYAACEAELARLKYQREVQSVIRAPYDGQIRTRSAEEGDMASVSSAVFELSKLEGKRVLCYLTELQLQAVKPGQKVRIIAASGDEIDGKVAYISPSAMFTPKSVQTESLRADLVWEVRADFTDPQGILRLGQPVTVEFK